MMRNFSYIIEEISSYDDLQVSFEFFPPKNERSWLTFAETLVDLNSFKVDFVSVTHGAGGGMTSSLDTLRTINHIKDSTDFDIAAHIAGIRLGKNELRNLLAEYSKLGVNKFVALRGDIPDNAGMQCIDYQYASDLVADIRNIDSNCKIFVAGYPDTHPESKNLKAEIDFLKYKVDQGASGIITQYFFDFDNYFRFVDLAVQNNISVPIIPGILPITNVQQMLSFSKKCAVRIPDWLERSLLSVKNYHEQVQLLGFHVFLEQCHRLVANNIKNLHFYTLNNYLHTGTICKLMGISKNDCN